MNHEYKSDVFSMLLQYQENALDIYNALNGTSYSDPTQVNIQTLPSGISLTVRNDASFIIDSYLNIYEHQSTFNPNMPVRSLFYVSKLLKELLTQENLYGKRLVQLPNIRCVVFYNGNEPQPEIRELRLSDAYIHKDLHPDVEVKCTVYNINKGNNENLLNACKVLNDYMYFVDRARTYLKSPVFTDNPEAALRQAIDDCIENRVLDDFFLERREEILKIIMLDWTYERRFELELREAKAIAEAEGRAEGEAEGRAEGEARGIVLMGRRLQASDEVIIMQLKQALAIDDEKAKTFLDEYTG